MPYLDYYILAVLIREHCFRMVALFGRPALQLGNESYSELLELELELSSLGSRARYLIGRVDLEDLTLVSFGGGLES